MAALLPLTIAGRALGALLRGRNRIAGSAAWEALREPRFAMQPVSLLGVLITVAVLAAGVWFARWDARRDRDQWWRDQLAASNAAVAEVMAKAQPAIDATDAEVLAAIGETHAKLQEAERRLRNPAPASSGCPLIRPECLRPRGGGQ